LGKTVLFLGTGSATLLFEDGYLGVAPKVFQFVKLAGLGIEDVDDDIKVIKADPVGVPSAGSGFRQFPHFQFQAFLDVVGDGGNLGGTVTLADEEKIGRPIVQFAQVEADDVFAFYVADGVENQIQTFLRVGGK